MLSATPPAAAQDCVEPPSGLVAWWPLDEASGTTAEELVSDNDGTFVGTTAAAEGIVGGARRFDSDGGDCVSVPDNDLWDFGPGDFTIELWLNLDSPTGGSQGQPGDVLLGHDDGAGHLNKWGLALAPGQIEFVTDSAATQTSTFAPITPFSPATGEWHHLAITRSGTTYSTYIDGQFIESEQNIADIPPSSSTLTIGCTVEFWDGYVNGRMDEVSIYSTALTAQELASIHAAGAAGKCGRVATTTTTTSTSSTSSSSSTSTSTTTTTTVPAPLCADANVSGTVTATDALAILKGAVSSGTCPTIACVCDVNGDSKVLASDSLAALKIAVGQPVVPACPCQPQ